MNIVLTFLLARCDQGIEILVNQAIGAQFLTNLLPRSPLGDDLSGAGMSIP